MFRNTNQKYLHHGKRIKLHPETSLVTLHVKQFTTESTHAQNKQKQTREAV